MPRTSIFPKRLVGQALGVGAVVAALTAAACSMDSTGPTNGASQIAFTTNATSSSSASLSLVPVTVGGHTLDLTAVRLTVARAELKRSASDLCPGDNDRDDDDHPPHATSTTMCGELKIGPTFVDLPLDGGMTSIPADVIPAGSFRAFELRVTQVELKGTFDGKAFDIPVIVNTRSEIEFATPLVVVAGQPVAVTVNVPVNGWLVNSDGSLIDPRAIGASSLLQAQVRSHVAASFHAFEDRDHDGKDDHAKGHD